MLARPTNRRKHLFRIIHMFTVAAPPSCDVELAFGGVDAFGGALEDEVGGLGVFVALVAPVVWLGGHFLVRVDGWWRV